MAKLIPFRPKRGRTIRYDTSRVVPRRSPFLGSLRRNFGFLAILAVGIFLAVHEEKIAVKKRPAANGYLAIDGDTLWRGREHYRLNGIDAPELHQDCRDAGNSVYPCGRDAKEALRGLISGKSLACDIHGTDRYGRSIAVCTAGTLEINAEMVRLGWAIAYRQHSLAYLRQEDEARRARRGIWRGRFETPQDWRKQYRGQALHGARADADLQD